VLLQNAFIKYNNQQTTTAIALQKKASRTEKLLENAVSSIFARQGKRA
jgi:hypothetical protein